MNAKNEKKSANKIDLKDKDKKTPQPVKKNDFVGLVGLKSTRKIKARRNPTPGIWLGLGMMGLIGWSVVVPTLLGLALGLWLDSNYPVQRSWTLALLIAGLVLGCFNAWYWVDKEQRAMHDEKEDQDE